MASSKNTVLAKLRERYAPSELSEYRRRAAVVSLVLCLLSALFVVVRPIEAVMVIGVAGSIYTLARWS